MNIKKHQQINQCKVIISLLLFLVIVVSSIAISPGITANAYTITSYLRTAHITTANVNVRSGPGTSYSSYGVLPKNSAIESSWHVSGTVGDWTKITLRGGSGNVTAYINSAYLKKVTTNRMYKSTSNINIRKGPGTSYGIVSSYTTGAQDHLFYSHIVSANGYNWVPAYELVSSYYISSKYYIYLYGWTAINYWN